MKKLLLLSLLTFTFLLPSHARTRQLFDSGWQFTRNGKTIAVDLPHDWDIYEAPDPATGATGTGGGWYQGGQGEYRKSFVLKRLAPHTELYFEGVYERADIYVNGHEAGHHDYGYTSFAVDITPYLVLGRNEVVVRVDNSHQPNCRWYSGSGIYRHVWLEESSDVHFAPHQGPGINVVTLGVADGKAQLRIKATMVNEKGGFRDGLVFTARVGDQSKQVNIKFLEQQPQMSPVEFLDIAQPRLWTLDKPEMYTAHLTLAKDDGTVLDEMDVPFGIRTIEYDAKHGFRLNGQPVLINGACLHHDAGVLGAMAFDDAEVRKVRLMKEAGFNLIRTAHNPPSPAFLAACDTLGMLVIDEAFDGWRSEKNPHDFHLFFDAQAEQEVRAMVRRDVNHPSIIAWSIGNEVIERKDLRVVTTARRLKAAARSIDTSRPVTEALCAWDNDWEIYDPHAEVLDIVGYNYMIHKHASDHQRDPQRIMWQTESYPRDAFSNWALVHDYPYIIGDIVWTGLDYLGESGIGRFYYEGERQGEHYIAGGQPDWHGAYCGDIDITGWRKPISHYRQILWQQPSAQAAPLPDGRSTVAQAASLPDQRNTGVGLFIREPNGYHGTIKETAWSVWPTWESWTWPGWEGKPIDVEIYTKAPEAKLYLNDQLVGTKTVSRDTQFKAVFTLPYQPGTLRAEAGGETVTLATAGAPARLRLTADRRTTEADGQSLAFIIVEVVDKEGRVCPEAAIPCDVVVSGQGTLMAAASADLKDREPYTTPHVTTWKGRAIIIVRSTQRKGQISVKVKSQLPTASMTLRNQ